jgi:hypothetical protein
LDATDCGVFGTYIISEGIIVRRMTMYMGGILIDIFSLLRTTRTSLCTLSFVWLKRVGADLQRKSYSVQDIYHESALKVDSISPNRTILVTDAGKTYVAAQELNYAY